MRAITTALLEPSFLGWQSSSELSGRWCVHHPQWGQHDTGDKQMLTVTLAAVTSLVIIGHFSQELNGLPGLIVLDPERNRWDVRCVSAVVWVCVTSPLVQCAMLLSDVYNFRIQTFSLINLGKTVSRRNVRRSRPSRSSTNCEARNPARGTRD